MDKEISKLPEQLMNKIDVPFDIEHLARRNAFNIILETAFGLPCEILQDIRSIWLDVLDKAEIYFIQRIYNPLYWYTRLYLMFDAGKKYKKNLDKVDEGLRMVDVELAKLKKVEEEKSDNNNNRKIKESGSLLNFLTANNLTNKIKIDMDGISDELLTMAAAGHETVANALRWTLFTLGNSSYIDFMCS